MLARDDVAWVVQDVLRGLVCACALHVWPIREACPIPRCVISIMGSLYDSVFALLPRVPFASFGGFHMLFGVLGAVGGPLHHARYRRRAQGDKGKCT